MELLTGTDYALPYAGFVVMDEFIDVGKCTACRPVIEVTVSNLFSVANQSQKSTRFFT